MLPVVNYRLREDLRTLIVCLYNPHDMPETRFTTDNLINFIIDCEWQLETGEPVRRIPFYVTPSPTDAKKACDHLQQALQELRKLKQAEDESVSGSPADQDPGRSGNDTPVGYIGDGQSAGLPSQVPTKRKKDNTPYHLIYRNKKK